MEEGRSRMKLKKKIGKWIAQNLLFLDSSYRFEHGNYLFEKFYREEFLHHCMRFLAFNQIEGDYLEFGVWGGITFIYAHKHSRKHGLSMHLYGFDSFKGLPKLEGIDIHPQWAEGAMATSIEEFTNTLELSGISRSEYTIVPGFYSESLTTKRLEELGIKKAALVYIDCDLYESTVPVLRFILPVLQTGTVIAFDDWYSFNGDPERGGQLALKEFLQQNSEIRVNEYLNFGWHGKSFIVKKNGDSVNLPDRKKVEA
jgi:O-methyltransferase